MPYNGFTDGKPVGTDQGPAALDYIRNNAMALRDALVLGAMSGWKCTPSDSTGQPASILYEKLSSTEKLRATITWGSSAGADGNPTRIYFQYTSDGTTYMDLAPYKYKDFTYAADGTVTLATWSNT